MSTNREANTPFQPQPATLGALVALATLTALVSLWLWAELLVARAGGATFCALSAPDACARLWDGKFASAVHRLTGVPVAGWGLVWALAAVALPLISLVRAAEGRRHGVWLSAVRAVAAAGVAAVVLLVLVALREQTFCLGCSFTYALTFGYAGIALVVWRPLGWPERQRAFGLAAVALAMAFGLLLYPGRQTPSKTAASGRSSLLGVGSSPAAGGAASVSAPSGSGASAAAAPAGPLGAAAGGPALANDAVSRFVATLPPAARQTLADSLYLYRNGIALPLDPPRTLIGAAAAPLRITEFTDIRCGHCADLHATLTALEREAPAGSFAVEPRQFPLDGACNPVIRQASDPVRCLAAQARICTEGRTGAAEYASRLFGQQASLTVDDVYRFANEVMGRAELERCVGSAETTRKLQSDIELAMRYELDGTPLVLLNGRKATSFAPFLYLMALTGGRADHPAFSGLPPGNPQAHIH